LLDARVRWLERARNLAKELAEVREEWVLAEAKALLAEWLIARRHSLNIGLPSDELANAPTSCDVQMATTLGTPDGID
jgi:hypothetical protein